MGALWRVRATTKVKTPYIYLEQLFRKAPVPDEDVLKVHRLMETHLHMTDYMEGALELLIQEGLLTEEDEDGNEVTRVYERHNDLCRKADELVLQLNDDPILTVEGWRLRASIGSKGSQTPRGALRRSPRPDFLAPVARTDQRSTSKASAL